MIKKRSFFDRLTGAVPVDDDYEMELPVQTGNRHLKPQPFSQEDAEEFSDEPEEGQLTVDVYTSGSDIIIKTMVAGVKPEDLDIVIGRSVVTIKGHRETDRTVQDGDYVHQELYWGNFSRSVTLPDEVEVEEAEAIEKHGLLIIKLPKIDKNKQARLKIKG